MFLDMNSSSEITSVDVWLARHPCNFLDVKT